MLFVKMCRTHTYDVEAGQMDQPLGGDESGHTSHSPARDSHLLVGLLKLHATSLVSAFGVAMHR